MKATLFLTAGNILAVYGSKRVDDVRGVLRTAPATGAFWVLGLFAITGAPPFGTFVEELAILRSAADRGSWIVAAVYLVALVAAFIGMASVMLRMAQGAPPGADRAGGGSVADTRGSARSRPGSCWRPLLALGLVSPSFLNGLISAALEGLHL